MNSNTMQESELHLYFDGELDETRCRAVESWLVENPQEAERLANWAQQRQAFREAFDPVLSEAVPERTMHLANAHQASSGRKHAFAALLAFAIFSGGFATAILAFGIEGLPQTIAAAAIEAHRLYAPEKLHPVEVVASDSQHLTAWLTKRVGVEVSLPQIGLDGVTLLGGRLVPAGGQPAALLMYQSASGERYTLLVTKAAGDSVSGRRYVEEGNFGALAWRNQDRDFVLSGPAGADELLELKAALRDG